MQKYDIKALVTNKRTSGKFFATGYRPAFQILDDYLTTGEITLINKDILQVNETGEAFIRFLTPEVYPKSLSIGKKIVFQEGDFITGEIIVVAIFNHILEAK